MNHPHAPQQQQQRTIKVVAGYGLHQRLGSGSFATVYKGIKVNQATPGADTVAIKAITRTSEKLTKKVLQNLEIEISILQTYRHRNIVCLQDVQKTERHFYLILEYCGGGDLQQLIRTRKTSRLTERLTRRLMRDLSAGLRFLWRQELVHRDIKPQNLLLTGALPLDELHDPERTDEMEAERRRINYPSAQFTLKIADFGFARHLQTASLAETLCGSPLYMAPEILQHHRYDAKADLWSVGTVLFEMIAGRPPFHGENHIDLLRNIQRKAVRLPPEVRVSKACVNLLRLLLNRNPLSRAGFKEFFEACDAFVALGCEGVATVDNGSCRRRSSKNLGSIPEDAAAAAATADSIMTVQTTTHQQQQQPPPQQTTSPSTPHQAKAPAQVPSQFLSTPPIKPVVARNYPQLQPLEPSPPPTMGHVLQPTNLPHLPSLDLQQQQQQQTTHITFQSQPQNVELAQMGRGSSLQNSDGGDSGFVLVEHGSAIQSPAATAIVSSHDTSNNNPSSYQRRGPTATRLEASPPSSPRYHFMAPPTTTNPGRLVPNETNTANVRVPKGMLSTSPGTGGALMGMLRGKRIGYGNNPSNANVNLNTAKNHWEAQIGAATKLLATAEDVGRRAVSVAHLGDARAYLALRLSLINENGSSLLSVTPMEGVVEEEGEEDNDAITGDSTSTEIMTTSRRPRSVSMDMKEAKDEEEAEEMPFACVSQETTSASVAPGMPHRSHPPLFNNKSPSTATSKHVIKPTRAIVQAHFKEALSCYLKTLQMLKGAVTAAQNVDKDLAVFMSQQQYLSLDQRNRVLALQKQCGVTAGWLSGQFKGVLERGDAANVEISKLEVPSHSSQNQSSQASEAQPVTPVEELIYNHALACGREGAVKQLLGQFEAARSCYRSAGLLAETLLMEANIGSDDRKILEGYVDGFAARITELDGVMLQQSRLAASSTTSTTQQKRGSGIVGLIGQPMLSPPFSSVTMTMK